MRTRRLKALVYTVSVTLLALPLLILLGCGGGFGPDGSNSNNPSGSSGSSTYYRLVRESDGQIHDRALAGTVCVFAKETRTCKLKCFPPEPLFRACGGDGLEYWYTRQYLTLQYSYGSIPERNDTDCNNDTTYRLVKLVPSKPETAFDCADKRFDITPSLSDRNWYIPRPPPYPAAEEKDLMPPTQRSPQ